jgi:tRNA (cytidine/uridine-2'-O-)-methyltransferase
MRLALFQPDIPQNLGAAVRLTACLGLPLDVIEPCSFPLSDKALKRTAMDYGATAEVVLHASWTEFLNAEARLQGRLLLFTTGGEAPFHRFDYQPGDTLLFGRESAGAPAEVHAAAYARLLIPIKAETRSLNLVTAAALALGCALGKAEGFPSAPAWS